ncbi:16S rRNA (guanine(966)-N(2))-methyltransferase RsmD [Kribbella qitaiheensis]|uniref:16S rRNA (Guanine(966)-N(2))-methyltransferase RsmD n=1 Tax=Kribbella qitaiheensis TaxID=1544730 RepID=A0A7G6WUD9_9ACTN|nr:16S rRNA (guanine(966)-N(2))-methyltransferase RsmD [Kribbella qitaiheensis]QNE17604.1 16S rRNA (guanine(966)-N(2))-methyltransferase RsmD [Kribbella qitaiheensis]
MTRIIGGAAGGRRIVVPPGSGTRPTTDRLREAMFSSLEAEFGSFDGLAVMDLYAGSGAIGLEALSRGAARVVLVESDRTAADVVAANVKVVGLPGATVLTRPAEKVASGDNSAGPFDLVFADPPYKLETLELQEVLTSLRDNGWLTEDAVVVVERGKREPWEWPEGFSALRDRKYGEARIWYGHRHDQGTGVNGASS